jgi:prepilin-type N-terminal cleavage/methylation domain-containing protein
MTLSRALRPGYTLLEVLLASAIAVMLMAALYVGMDIQLRAVQAGREKVNETNLVRNLIARMSADAVGTITPITATATISSASGETTSDPVVPFNGGVQGDNGLVTFWVSRLPNIPTDPNAVNMQLGASDLHRISYWVTDSGLLREDADRVSASDDDADTPLPPGVSDESKYVFAQEVTAATFRYFDGTNWQDTWDGTVVGPDGKTPVGPPRCIEVVLSIRRYGADPNDDSAIKQYRQVIPINAGNAQSSSSTATTSGATGTSGTSGTTGGTSP